MTETTKSIAEVVGRTLQFFATDQEEFSFSLREISERETAVQIECDPRDIGLILGGKGKNTSTVLELAQAVLPPGQFITVDFMRAMPPNERGGRTLAPGMPLKPAVVSNLHRVLVGWHRLLGSPDAKIRHEQTASAEIFVCDARELPGQAMKSLRIFVGWACTVRGRHGFIEWERW